MNGAVACGNDRVWGERLAENIWVWVKKLRRSVVVVVVGVEACYSKIGGRPKGEVFT